jgi:predicted AAA+ superfamily ATPase
MTLLPGKAQAVIGMRRAGKTCFLFQQMQERLAAGGWRLASRVSDWSI